MKKGIVGMLAVAGLAAAASAQGQAEWLLDIEYDGGHSFVGPGGADFATVRLGVEFSGTSTTHGGRPYVALAGADFGINAGDGDWSDLLGLEVSKVPVGSIVGPMPDIVGSNLEGGSAVQVWFDAPPTVIFIPSFDNPLWFFEARWTTSDFTTRDVSLVTTSDRFELYVEKESPGAVGGPSEPVSVRQAEGSIRVIPTPSSLALLGLGGLVALRRRR